ncbi:MAG: prepilin-type N-terminal cleavage/methylation domain-containing protein [Deltaproteobacteria bacterium]|nr:prepilin-type N-terminal cleavage/methylation domain-containing protein [Deltaproteobacteria bacterium]
MNHKGFTLVELMMVIAIIGILAGIAIPQFAAYKVSANNATSESDVRNLQSECEAIYTDCDSYPNAVPETIGPATITLSTLGGTCPSPVRICRLSKGVKIILNN